MPSVSQDKLFAELMQGKIDEIKMSHTALDEAIEWIGYHLSPDDVFSAKDLQAWAENNGYTKE